MRFTDLYEAPMVFYHGSNSPIKQFTLDFVNHNAVNQSGPGIYLTSSVDDAKRYGKFVHHLTVKVVKSRIMPDKKALPRELVQKLLWDAPNREDNLMDWDENPQKALRKAVDAVMGRHAPNEFRQAMETIWYDHYRGEEKVWLQKMVELGYDGFMVTHSDNTVHYICFNPSVITIDGIVD